MLPPRLQEQLKYNRFVNYSEGEGKNVAADEVIELYNMFANERIKYLGPNLSPHVIMKIGRTVDYLQSRRLREA